VGGGRHALAGGHGVATIFGRIQPSQPRLEDA
jgi:hypothetical protein